MAPPRQLERITVGEAEQRYTTNLQRRVAGGTLSPATQKSYLRDIHDFANIITRDRILDDLTEDDLDDAILEWSSRPDARYREAQPGGKSQGAVARHVASIRAFFTWAEKNTYLQRNPTEDMTIKPRQPHAHGNRTALPLDTAQAILTTQTRNTKTQNGRVLAKRDELTLRLLIETGARVNELCLVNTADIHTRDGQPWMNILHGKGGKTRSLPLTPSTADLITEWLKVRPEPWSQDSPERQEDSKRALLLTRRGRRITPRDIQNICTHAAKRLPPDRRRGFTPHALRHTMATLMISSGTADIAVVQRLLGHASLATTGIYLDEVQDELVRAIQQNPVTGGPVRPVAAQSVNTRKTTP